MANRKPSLYGWIAAGLAVLVAALPSDDGARAAVERAAVAVVDPVAPGADIPPVGRSLFDHLTAADRGGARVYDVPFPFTALVDRIARELDAQSGAPIKRVLIPLGRSLQRVAAAPHYFAFPRVVAAVDAEPATASPFYLKDRLYLGYQEKANVVEVISYNEAAGRFEFQVVRNYAPGQTPEVVYASRALCTTCHQNEAPIFSRQQWDETSANPDVAARIRSTRSDGYGVDLSRGVDVPYAIDNATDRANRFAATQLVWRDGCGDAAAAPQRCRAGLFGAALRFRLSGRSEAAASPQFQATVVAPLVASARVRWPAGLAIADPDIPNRNPLSSDAMRKPIPQIESPFDPLTPRAPLEVWTIDGAASVSRVVGEVAEFVSAADIARLDAALASSWTRRDSTRTAVKARCDVRRTPARPSGEAIDFDCAGDARNGLRLQARVQTQGTTAATIALARLQLGDEPPMIDLAVTDARAALRPTGGTVSGAPRRGALRARSPVGDGVERITLRFDGTKGDAEASIVGDSARIDAAVNTMLADSAAGRFDGFDARPFRRAKLMPALLGALGAPPREACCVVDGALPAARVDASPAAEIPPAASAAGLEIVALQRFYRYCSACHLTAEPAPPNFLAGDAAAVREKMTQCAPRIFVRLGMWQRPGDAHAKTPMPPEVALARYQLTVDAWRASGDLAAMSSYAAKLVEARAGRPPERADVLARNYEELPSCLPAVAAGHTANVR
jgi:hypothetical protein